MPRTSAGGSPPSCSPTARHDDGELAHDPSAQVRWPDHLRRCRSRRPWPADRAAPRGAGRRRRRRRRRVRSPAADPWRSPAARSATAEATPAETAKPLLRRGPQRAVRSCGWSPATRSPTRPWSRRRSPSAKTVVPVRGRPGRADRRRRPRPTPACRSGRCTPRSTCASAEHRRLRGARRRAGHAGAHRRRRRGRRRRPSSWSPTA